MKSFKSYIHEMNAAGAGGVFGTGGSFGHGGEVGNTDFYASGDSRVPHVLGIYSRNDAWRGKKKKSRKNKKEK